MGPLPTCKSGLLAIANEILFATYQLVDSLQKEGLEEPSFDEDATQDLYTSTNTSLREAKSRIIDHTQLLRDLVIGPFVSMQMLAATQFDCAALRTVLEFEVLKHIPSNEGASPAAIAEKVGISEDRLGRMLRLLATLRITTEVEDNVFKHTALSRKLADDWEFTALVLLLLDETNKASAWTTEYFRSKPFNDLSHDSPFSFVHGKPFYEWYDDNPRIAARFAAGQEGIGKMGRSTGSLMKWLSTRSLQTGAKIVDVGAGNAFVTVQMAEEFPKFKYVAQDLNPKFFEATKTSLTSELASRISFVSHDFFSPQAVDLDVGAYVLRSCLHNWSDADSLDILRGFEGSLKANPSAKLLINEMIVPESGAVSHAEDQYVRRSDMAMLVIANSKQRSIADWQRLIDDAKCGLGITDIIPERGGMSIIEVSYIEKRMS